MWPGTCSALPRLHVYLGGCQWRERGRQAILAKLTGRPVMAGGVCGQEKEDNRGKES